MSPSRNHVVMMLLALVCISGASSQKVHVSILNRLGEGKSISIHCQSKDNDLGPQTVADEAEYGWGFSVNFSGTTLFYCNMGWGSVRSFTFSAYDYQRDRGRCSSNCSWIMAEEDWFLGVYVFLDWLIDLTRIKFLACVYQSIDYFSIKLFDRNKQPFMKSSC